MLVELIERGEPVDQVLFADVGAEKTETMDFVPIFRAWLAARGVPSEVVRYTPKTFKNWPPYRTLTENLLTNGTLPGIAFGRGTCSQKWKAAPQHAWAQAWPPAREAWAAGRKVVKLIGFDAGAADDRRYRVAAAIDDPLYEHRYPLREWGWTRPDSIRRIRRAGLPVPPKSACFFCTAARPQEVRTLPVLQLRQIVLIEARAQPRLRNVEGLWRKAVKGARGAEPRPGSMTAFIRQERLLDVAEIDGIVETAPRALLRWQDAVAQAQMARPEMGRWMTVFDAFAGRVDRLDGAPGLYDGLGDAP
ncbi:hypothetical protein [Phenylobacterium aquaticum]|uniref:hypothetical protein n=1 Tax=Phenylobacterium aquaticum TaxID=1763816 RepID=UPI001F5D89FC|nr:hypothetical protein [Phenylobacterium aquaticum]MCI3130969.1 hypothetical protein [Phenylobacterium aquaticum]